MPERQTWQSAIRISRGILSIFLPALAAVGGATGNPLIAGASAFPAAANALYPRPEEDQEERLILPTPPWWTTDAASWQIICSTLETQLPALMQRVAARLKQVDTLALASTIREAFASEIAASLPLWETRAQDRALIAEYVTPRLLQQFATTVRTLVTPLREEASLALLVKLAATLDSAQQPQALPPAPPVQVSSGTPLQTPSVASVLAAKQRAEAYDVYICYAEADEAEVMGIGEQLRMRGILPWFDELESKPGTPKWLQQEQQIERIPKAAIFVGQHAIVRWQTLQMYAFLEQFVTRGCPVIPVQLASAPQQPKLPPFLSTFAWVDMRKPGAIGRLLWGITDIRPDAGQS